MDGGIGVGVVVIIDDFPGGSGDAGEGGDDLRGGDTTDKLMADVGVEPVGVVAGDKETDLGDVGGIAIAKVEASDAHASADEGEAGGSVVIEEFFEGVGAVG